MGKSGLNMDHTSEKSQAMTTVNQAVDARHQEYQQELRRLSLEYRQEDAALYEEEEEVAAMSRHLLFTEKAFSEEAEARRERRARAMANRCHIPGFGWLSHCRLHLERWGLRCELRLLSIMDEHRVKAEYKKHHKELKIEYEVAKEAVWKKYYGE